MKKLLFLSALLFAGILSAQVKSVDTSQKDVIAANSKSNTLDEQFNIVAQILESKAFVIEANSFEENGNRSDVNSTINFVKVDANKSTIQKGNDAGKNYKGIGEYTAEGDIASWKLEKDEKHKLLSLRMNVVTYGGSCDVLLNINESGDASASISGLAFIQITLRGKLVKLEDSKIYVNSHL